MSALCTWAGSRNAGCVSWGWQKRPQTFPNHISPFSLPLLILRNITKQSSTMKTWVWFFSEDPQKKCVAFLRVSFTTHLQKEANPQNVWLSFGCPFNAHPKRGPTPKMCGFPLGVHSTHIQKGANPQNVWLSFGCPFNAHPKRGQPPKCVAFLWVSIQRTSKKGPTPKMCGFPLGVHSTHIQKGANPQNVWLSFGCPFNAHPKRGQPPKCVAFLWVSIQRTSKKGTTPKMCGFPLGVDLQHTSKKGASQLQTNDRPTSLHRTTRPL